MWSDKMLGAGLDSTWFLLGSSLCEPQKSRFRLGGVEQILGSGLGSTWFRLGSCAHGWQSLPEAQVCSLAVRTETVRRAVQTSQQQAPESMRAKFHQECKLDYSRDVQTSQKLGREFRQPKIHKEWTPGAHGWQSLPEAQVRSLAA